jgi:hypothetical protein
MAIKSERMKSFLPITLQPKWGLGLLFWGFLISQRVSHTRQDFCGRVISPPQRPLPTQYSATYKHKRQTSMPWAGFEPAIPATKRPQTYASDRMVTGIDERMKWPGHITHGETRNAYWILFGNPEEKRHLRRPWRRWEDNIKMNPNEIRCDSVKLINFVQDTFQWRAAVNAAMNFPLF